MSSKSNYINNNKKSKNKRVIVFVISSIFILFFLISLNFLFKTRNIQVSFFDEKSENIEIQKYLETEIRKNSNSLSSFWFLDENLITKLVRDEFQTISNIKFSKKINMNLEVVVSKNDAFLHTCVDENYGFLINCMLGNADGTFFNESINKPENILEFDVNPKTLYERDTELKADRGGTLPDSLSGLRIYTKANFNVLVEIILWLQKNGSNIKKVYVNELNIVDIYTDNYMIRVSLDKGFSETVKDFELISKAGKLQEYVNEKKDKGTLTHERKIKYIDLSFKNKVFFKLKNTDTIEIKSTSTKIN